MLVAINLAKLACVRRNTPLHVTKPRAKKVEAAGIDPEVANNDGEDADADKESVHRGAYSLNASKWRTVASQNIVYFSLYSPPNSRNNDSNQLLQCLINVHFTIPLQIPTAKHKTSKAMRVFSYTNEKVAYLTKKRNTGGFRYISSIFAASSLGCSFQTRSVSGLEKENSRATKPDQEKENQFSAIATEKLVQNFEPASV
ncbi:hypothetical protein BPOR_0583g00090 [Botrytis porri]|uniref:Uncharacterized protein n=1 Tax=Botrytis porri TaxID=87229 RepID=A0A4Z1KCN5_9HELO|nr:hypothetical protein BPOR_0583g00090 [Botrytis porri]